MQLTTYRKTGVGVPTPVGFAPQADMLYVTTPPTAGKLKRIRNSGRVTVAPCTRKGAVLGEPVEAWARILAPEERSLAERAFVSKYHVIYSLFLFVQKLRPTKRDYIEIRTAQE
jgi:hypothetical protein